MSAGDRLLSSIAYLFGIPALYIVLTGLRKKPFVGNHGGQALLLWVCYFAIFFTIRLLVNLVWSVWYVPHLEKLEAVAAVVMAGYAVYCAFRALGGQEFNIPR